MKAVIYARYSSASQREESIEGQVKECTAYAERNGYMVIGTYADRAVSGTTDNRPEFQRMIKDSKRKQFDLVIVWKLDRFARNRYVSAKYKSQLKQNGVTTKLFCGHCGTAMNGESGKSRNGAVHRYYKCHAVKKKLNDCKKKSIRKEEIEDLVVKETMAMLMDDAMIEAIVSMLMRLQDEENTDLPMYEKQLRQTETAIDNIVTAVMNGMASKALQAKLTELEETKEELLVRIEEEKLEKPKISAEFMTFWLHRFRKLDVTNVQHRRMLIDTFVNAVFLYDDKLLLTYNFKDGTRTITFNDVKTAANKAGSDLDCLGAPGKGAVKPET